MNKVAILSDLVNSVVKLTHCSESDAELFVSEAFRLASEKLEADSRVEIPGLGTFAVTDDNIAFAPDAQLAGELNTPFNAFEAVELPDDYVEDDNDSDTAIAEAAEFEEQEDAITPCEEVKEIEEPNNINNSGQSTEAEPVAPIEPTPTAVENVRKKSGLCHWIWAAACIACFALGWFANDYMPTTPTNIDTSDIADIPDNHDIDDIKENAPIESPISEPIEEIETPATITDTISSSRFLTTMARKHYGRMEFWVYIYEANANILGHPDRLSAGQIVTIPQLDIDPDNQEEIEKAKRKATEIYARFN